MVLVLVAGLVAASAVGWFAVREDAAPPVEQPRAAGFREGGCAMPDPDKAPKGVLPVDCSDARATTTVRRVVDLKASGGYPDCPSGTDSVIVDPSDPAGPRAVCLRNTGDTHPGDPGQGGGLLVVGDCVRDVDAITEVPCAREGALKVLALVAAKDKCPADTTKPLDIEFGFEGAYKVICTSPR